MMEAILRMGPRFVKVLEPDPGYVKMQRKLQDRTLTVR